MNKKIYLLSTALLILGALLSCVSGWRYFLSPVYLFKIGTILNIIFSVGLGLILAYMLSLRFYPVWKGSVDISLRAKTKHAIYLQNISRLVIYGYYILLPLYLALMLLGSPIRGEIRFLFSPLMKVLPVGWVLFEISRLIDFDARLKKANKTKQAGTSTTLVDGTNRRPK